MRPAAAGARRGVVRAVLVTVRPRQWVKNVLVVAAGALGRDGVPGRVVVAFLAFCLLAYLLVLDVVAIAGGFVLRGVAGGVAAPVALSRWFLLVVTCVAVFVAAGKRDAELRRTAAGGGARRVLERYSAPRLRLLLATSAAGALVAYCVWALRPATARLTLSARAVHAVS